MELLITLLYIIFVLAALLLVVVILLQEGKGGGFGDALGVAGQQTFGVKASGIHKFTAIVAVVFLVSALCIHILNRSTQSGSSLGGSVLGDGPAGAPVSPGSTGSPTPPPQDR